VVLEAGPKAALYLGFKETLDPAPWLARWQDGLKKLPALQAAAGDFDAFNRWSLGKDSASLASLPEALRADAESLRQLNRDTLEIMNRFPLKAGEVLFNAQEDAAGRLSAAVHALGTAHGDAGQALILEIRRPGVTFRAWDHGRLPQRNVDPATALAASPLQASCPDDFKVTIRPGPTACLARCEAFTAWRLAPEDDAPLQRDTQERVRTLHVLEGTALIESAGGALRLRRGQSALLPARLGSWTLTGPAVAVEAAPGAVP
jgi:mannose-6-phosphate isomerase class I